MKKALRILSDVVITGVSVIGGSIIFCKLLSWLISVEYSIKEIIVIDTILLVVLYIDMISHYRNNKVK